jgi:WhiB family redox-sensing transcriptional regulator
VSSGDGYRRLSFDPAAWRTQAACRGLDPELFYPKRGTRTAPARKVCAACPVRADCLEYALANFEKDGIWGGTTGKERRAIRRTRRATKRGAAA